MSCVISLPCAVLRVLHTLERAGYPAYLVGGSLRDALRGCLPHDFDVTTPATPAAMQRVFAQAGFYTIETGLKHGTLTVLIEDEPIECTTYRVETTYSDGRHPDAVAFTDRLADDLCRRDFTVNAMACRLPAAARADFCTEQPLTVEIGKDAELVDLYGGVSDLQNGILRCVGQAERRFEEDGLRILRCVRFAVQLAFTVEAQTRAALASCRERLHCVSAERCSAEWLRLLSCGMPVAYGLGLIEEAGLWQFLLPASGVSPAAADVARAVLLPGDAPLRIAQLLRHAAYIYIKDNSCTPDALARRVCAALRLSGEQSERIAALLQGSYLPCPTDDVSLRRYMARCGALTEQVLLLGGLNDLPDEICLAAAQQKVPPTAHTLLSPAWRDALARCAELRARGDCLTRDGLALKGKDLYALGLRGREIGAAQSYLLEQVLQDPARNQAEILTAIVRRKMACGTDGFSCVGAIDAK